MMEKDLAVTVNKISKIYRIGLKEERSDSFGGALFKFLKSPLENYRRYRSLYKFNDMTSQDDSSGTSEPADVLWALKDISFQVKKGEMVGIIGRNGAGKSTLLKVLCKITDPTSGNAQIKGRVSSLLEVGTGFHQELTGRENVYLNGTILGMTRKEVDRKFHDIVEFSGVKKFIDTPVKRYSSGMRVRLAFAVAAYLEPEILIIDEVLAVGDADFQKKCLNKMEDVGQRGKTVLFVSHNMSAVTRFCNRTILMEDGKIIDDGPSPQVVKTYLNSGFGTMAAREWPKPAEAPQGEIARLRSVKIIDKDGHVSESVDIRQPVGLEMKYDLLKPGYQVMPFYHLYNEEGIEIFGVHDTDPEWLDKDRPKGRYTSIAWIPGNLLSEGTIFISVGLSSLNPHVRQFYEPSTVGFRVVESHGGGVTARGGYSGPMSGIIRPLLEWETRHEAEL